MVHSIDSVEDGILSNEISHMNNLPYVIVEQVLSVSTHCDYLSRHRVDVSMMKRQCHEEITSESIGAVHVFTL